MTTNLQTIKLIIWDLDETIWNGVVSEGDVFVKEGYEAFIQNTLDMGIVHSICSKNDFEVAKQKLTELGLWDHFVFPSIDWQAKGARVKNIIDSMALRSINVLFVDDNPQNLNEAKCYCPDLNIALPEEVQTLFESAETAQKKDPSHKRLKQYRVLERKNHEQKQFASNDDFLFSCNIQVEIRYDCMEQADRLHELLIRSNQLNFTKIRPTREEFQQTLLDPECKCGYVCVKDRFGDYGVIGFFAIKHDRLEHFAFSCRTLGMQVEQYVYMQLECPQLQVVGDVVASLNEEYMPQWINQKNENAAAQQAVSLSKGLLLKGPCDMSQIFSFIKEGENIKGELSYTNGKGILTEGHNHTSQILTALEASEREKAEIIGQFSWIDQDSLTTTMASGAYDCVVLSMLTDGNLGVYRNKKNGRCIALCESYYDITSPRNRQKYLFGEVFTSNICFSEKDLDLFAQTYEYDPSASSEKHKADPAVGIRTGICGEDQAVI